MDVRAAVPSGLDKPLPSWSQISSGYVSAYVPASVRACSRIPPGKDCDLYKKKKQGPRSSPVCIDFETGGATISAGNFQVQELSPSRSYSLHIRESCLVILTPERANCLEKTCNACDLQICAYGIPERTSFSTFTFPGASLPLVPVSL